MGSLWLMDFPGWILEGRGVLHPVLLLFVRRGMAFALVNRRAVQIKVGVFIVWDVVNFE